MEVYGQRGVLWPRYVLRCGWEIWLRSSDWRRRWRVRFDLWVELFLPSWVGRKRKERRKDFG